MKKIVLVLSFLLMLQIGTASAEINKIRDDFDGSSYTTSDAFNIGNFNTVSLVRSDNDKNNKFFLLIKCRSSNPSYFKKESGSIKIDKDIYNLPCFSTSSSLNKDGTVYTDAGYAISDNLLKNIINAEKISIRVFLYGEKAYETFDLPPEILSEWKQLITNQ